MVTLKLRSTVTFWAQALLACAPVLILSLRSTPWSLFRQNSRPDDSAYRKPGPLLIPCLFWAKSLTFIFEMDSRLHRRKVKPCFLAVRTPHPRFNQRRLMYWYATTLLARLHQRDSPCLRTSGPLGDFMYPGSGVIPVTRA